MSNKYQVIGAKEEFRDDNPIPVRSLIFKGIHEDLSRSPNQQVFFSEDRTTLIYNGVLYDWYGREVMLGDNIKKVLRPFGHNVGNAIYSETFVVQRKDNKIAIAILSKDARIYTHFRYPLEIQTKDSILGKMLLENQSLNLRYKWYFKRELDPQKFECLKHSRHTESYRILTGVNYDYSPKERDRIYFCPTTEMHFDPISHLIMGDRKKILSTSCGSLLDYDNHMFPNTIKNIGIVRTGHLFGPFMYSDPSGDKISAFFAKRDGLKTEFIRISTDTEVLQYAYNNESLIWYYDPE
ncbi:hypothetical protein IKF43_01300 [Candidatus Saccharibacteria bacterium]|nr:hypothetical protein [Candidatus Saccharibacteria bacterium]